MYSSPRSPPSTPLDLIGSQANTMLKKDYTAMTEFIFLDWQMELSCSSVTLLVIYLITVISNVRTILLIKSDSRYPLLLPHHFTFVNLYFATNVTPQMLSISYLREKQFPLLVAFYNSTF